MPCLHSSELLPRGLEAPQSTHGEEGSSDIPSRVQQWGPSYPFTVRLPTLPRESTPPRRSSAKTFAKSVSVDMEGGT
jgi:hypothetical protein